MATRAPRATLHIPDSPDDENRALSPFMEPDAPEQTDVDRVASMLQIAGGVGRASVKVYKLENGKAVFCDSYQPQEFEDGDFKMIRDAFGAGSFRIMLYGLNPESGNFGILSRTDVTLAENRTPQRPAFDAYAPQSSQVPNGLAAALESLASGQKAMLDALVQARQAPPRDTMAEMAQMLTLMTTMREAMGLNQRPEKQSTIGEIVAAMREMREAATELIPNAKSDDDSLSGMLPQVLGLIQSGMQNNQAQPAQIAPTALPQIAIPQSLQSAQPAPQHQAQPTAESTDVNALEIIKLRANLKAIISMAKEGADPQKGADLIYEKLPDDMIELLALPEWFTALCALEDAAKPYQEWLTKARDLALAMFEPAEGENTLVDKVAP